MLVTNPEAEEDLEVEIGENTEGNQGAGEIIPEEEAQIIMSTIPLALIVVEKVILLTNALPRSAPELRLTRPRRQPRRMGMKTRNPVMGTGTVLGKLKQHPHQR